MAVELCSDTGGDTWGWSPLPHSGSLVGSPRLSFSRDLPRHSADDDGAGAAEGNRRDGSLMIGSPASSDFDFCVGAGADGADYDLQPAAAAADELFSGGKLLPVPILQQLPRSIPVVVGTPELSTSSSSAPDSPHPPTPARPSFTSIVLLEEEKQQKQQNHSQGNTDEDPGSEKPPPTPSKPSSPFWRFRRSSSLNYSCSDSGTSNGAETRRVGYIPLLPLLARSKSTGSNPYPVPPHKHQTRSTTTSTAAVTTTKYRCNTTTKPAPSSPSSTSYYSNNSSKTTGSGCTAALPYRHRHSNSNGAVRIAPIINVQPPCISKGRCGGGGGGLFGFGYLLCNGGDKTVRRRKKPAIFAQYL